MPSSDIWNVYKKEDIIMLDAGDTLKVNAMRIGYKEAIKDFVY